jgi:hypothetical protein
MEKENNEVKPKEEKKREPRFIVAVGRKGVGKTYKSLQQLSDYVKRGGKVLILDTNNEYGNVKLDHKNPDFVHIRSLDIKDLTIWVNNKIPEARRILPFRTGKEFGVLNMKEMQELLGQILKVFKRGLFVIEDPTKFVTDSLPSDLIGTLSTQRHKGADIMLHFQHIGKLGHPKIWETCNMVRLHYAEGKVERHKEKFGGHPTHLYLLEKLVENEFKKGNVRFCAVLDKDEDKIRGAFNKKQFTDAIEGYLQDNIAIVNKEIARVNLRTGEKVHKTRAAAIDFMVKDLMDDYYGNPK